MSMRLRRAQGEDLDGKTIRSRTGGVDTDMLSPLERAMVTKQLSRDLKGTEVAPTKKVAEPMEDPNATGKKVDYYDPKGRAPTIYTEAQGGRRDMRGKRKPKVEE